MDLDLRDMPYAVRVIQQHRMVAWYEAEDTSASSQTSPEKGLQANNGALRRRPCLRRKGQRLVSAVEELDGHEDHLLVANILKIMHLE